MLLIHPAIQLCASLLACYILFLGIQRFRMLHMKQKAKFNWKRHVLLGIISMVTFMAGMIGAMVLAYLHWHGILITGVHAEIALLILPLLLFGFLSGLYMNRVKKKRKILPLFHGIVNLILVLLALFQVYTGWWVYNIFILGN